MMVFAFGIVFLGIGGMFGALAAVTKEIGPAAAFLMGLAIFAIGVIWCIALLVPPA